MDYEGDWEFLPDSRFLEFPENPDERKLFSGNKQRGMNSDYFMCPSPASKKIVDASSGNSFRKEVTKTQQLVPVLIQLEAAAILKQGRCDQLQDPEAEHDGRIERSVEESDQDPVLSQVFFKKMKGNEFVDMKTLDSSPQSPRNNITPQIDSPSVIDNTTCSPRKKKKKIEDLVIWNHDHDHDRDHGGDDDYGLGLNLWKWSLSGIGAICSFGVAAAAATICVIVFRNQQTNKTHQQNQKLRLQIYTDDKRIKQVVARGVPISTAHITSGGYYDAN